MADLTTEYLGLKLKNPLIVSSCGKMKDLEQIRQAETSGAAAIVLPSLFEEDITESVEEAKANSEIAQHPEALTYLHQMGMLLKPEAYLEKLEQVKSMIRIPVIASLNCYSSDWWIDYARRIENAGADAIELNLGMIPVSVQDSASQIEDRMETVIKTTRKAIRLPITIKIGEDFTSLPSLLKRLHTAGADGFVLFNRFYRPDIDIESMSLKTGSPLSSRDELGPVLRWIGILSDLVPAFYSATTGVHEAEDLIKVIVAGANTAQICSVLYKKGTQQIKSMLDQLEAWLDKKGYASIDEIRSRLSLEDDKERKYYQRIQYVRQLKTWEQ